VLRVDGGGFEVTARRERPQAPPTIERLVKAIVVADKAVSLYPAASDIPLETAEAAAAVLEESLSERSEIRLMVTKQGLLYGDLPVYPDQSAYESFALSLYNHHLADIRFHVGATAKDIVTFLSIAGESPASVVESGGFESRLWDAGVGSITVTEAHVSIVEAGDPSFVDDEIRSMSRERIDEVLAAAYGGRSRDQMIVARFVGDPLAVSSYITETYAAQGAEPDLMAAAERFAELAEIAYETGSGASRAAFLNSLGQAFRELDPALRHALLVDEVLPEARTNEALAAVVRGMDVDEVCRILVEGLDERETSREGLARAIRNLSLISLSDREEVVTAAGAAMRGVGAGDSFVSSVLEFAAPSRVTVRESASTTAQAERPVDAIFKLMDLAPTPQRSVAEEDEPGLIAIRDEARRGIADGDVIMTLVTLVTLDTREVPFASTMSILEDSLGLLVERGEIDIAADAADALNAASQRQDLDDGQRARLRKAIGRFTKPADIKAIALALKLYAPDTPEHKAARRLLDTLGALAIEPLLEQLADEQDRTVRKSIVDLLSGVAQEYVSELGSHVSDPRWFVVRNVVQILGSTKSSAVLSYLERTVRHPEPRVRREVLRALSGINDRMAHQMMASLLDDPDAQNVQLAARYLGAADVRAAIPQLEQVALGEGRGCRDAAPRVEAIEALGRLGAAESLPSLEALAGKRSFLGASRARELRTAAEFAIARIKSGGGA
jgi:HEAT repeat protein